MNFQNPNTAALSDKKLYIFDMDGTIYLGYQVFPFAIRFINNLRAAGKKLLIAAKNELFLYEAVELLLESVIEPQKNDSGNPILIASSTNIAVSGNVNSLYYTIMAGSGDLLFTSTPIPSRIRIRFLTSNISGTLDIITSSLVSSTALITCRASFFAP